MEDRENEIIREYYKNFEEILMDVTMQKIKEKEELNEKLENEIPFKDEIEQIAKEAGFEFSGFSYTTRRIGS